ncbi:hypothetical protein DFAR_2230007 [Desulfarculales bacterium]
MVGISGISQKVYGQYHRGGQLGTVLENLRAVAAYKCRHSLSQPFLEWKFLAFPYSRHQMALARR